MATFFLLLIPLLAAICSMLVLRHRRLFLHRIAVVAAVAECCAVIFAAWQIGRGVGTASGAFALDSVALFVVILIAIVNGTATLYAMGSLAAEEKKNIVGFRRTRQYWALHHLFVFAMMLAILTTHPLILWIAVEGTTLATAFLISFYNKPTAMEAAWKFLIINSIGMLLGLCGTFLFLVAAQHAGLRTDLLTWHNLRAIASNMDPAFVKIAFIFIFIGYGTKIGFVPLHTWRPDAYSKAPTPIVALFSGVLLNVALVSLLRFAAVTSVTVGAGFVQHLFIFFGTLSMIIAALIMLVQKNYKRLLAYSTIEHAGVMMVGFGVGGAGAFYALFHMMFHTLLKAVAFFAAGNIFLKYSSTKIHNVAGALRRLPFSAPVFFLSLLLLAGIPPFGLFFTEMGLLRVTIEQFPTVAIMLIAAFSLVFLAFVRHAMAMLFGEPLTNVPAGEAGHWTIVPIVILLGIFVAMSIALPNSLLTWMNDILSLLSL